MRKIQLRHNIAIDYVRGVAMMVIVTCHFFMFGGVPGWEPLGQWFAGVGNFLFFAISALLFGLQYEGKGSACFLPLTFLRKRFIRLFPSLWIFLSIWLVIQIFILKEDVSPIKVIMNFLGGCWFAKLPSIGHLWFITMVIICYIMYVTVANNKLQIGVKLRDMGGHFWIVLLCSSMMIELAMDSVNIPGYLFVVLFYSLFFFIKASKVIKYANDIPLSRLLLLLVVSNSIALVLSYHQDLFLALSFYRFASCLAGFSWLLLMLRLNKKFKYDKALLFISSYSYELFLVHHIFCCGTFSIIKLSNSILLNYGLLWICAFCAAIILKFMGDRIYKRLIVT